MNDRATREKQYWNEAYRAEGLNHEKYVWSQSFTNSSYSEDAFNDLLRKFSGQKILTIGGGVDTVGVSLAKNNNRVVSVDISDVASGQTNELARQMGIEKNLCAVVMDCEEMSFEEKFDVVVCKRALHHMNLAKVIERVHQSLVEGGRFLAEEPVCLLKPMRWIHGKLPFHPSPLTDDEGELSGEDLALIESAFPEVKFHYMECLTRESIKYCLWKTGTDGLLRPLGRFDFSLVNKYLTPLKYLSTYAIIQAFK
ncbi:MAG TPA: class I SAM-dependent methyltransferase [Pyrinomonadaceae bacterium]|nr:class I SAM-dependent methyltransferase [Pyrinomonadaceae bacterium]